MTYAFISLERALLPLGGDYRPFVWRNGFDEADVLPSERNVPMPL
jgi:hypothetical protein